MSTEELPERLELASQSPIDERIEALRASFPEVFREGKVDFEALQRSLGDFVDPGRERFGLTWPGKAECMRVIQEPSIGTLVPMPEESVDWHDTQNVIIEGENLEVLKLLQKAYYGKVKLIYIDPPYNTGNEFIYPDNFREGLTDYLRYSGQVDEEGFKLAANAETDGRYHSKWLSMMYPRLFLARNLLREDGVIFISIDDHEVHNLRAVMNEIFGEENFVTEIEWQKRYTRSNNTDNFTSVIDHICVYQRSEAFTVNLLKRTAEADDRFTNPDDDPRGPWKGRSFLNQVEPKRRPTMCYPIQNPNTGVSVSPTTKAWRVSRMAFEQLEIEERLYWGADGRASVPEIKTFLSEVRPGMTPINFWSHEFAGHTDAANAEMKALFGERVFDTPKPSTLIRRILDHATVPGDLVMDFFAGSGTTGHAILEQNFETGAKLSFLLVQLPEPIDVGEFESISEIARERVRRAASVIQARPPQIGSDLGDLGFRSFRLSSSNFSVWDALATDAVGLEQQLTAAVDHLAVGATNESILSELLLKAGYPLASRVDVTSFAGTDGYSIAEGALIVCLSTALTIDAFEAMVECGPAMILVLDAGFGGSDELKVNALQTVRARNQQEGSDIALRVV